MNHPTDDATFDALVQEAFLHLPEYDDRIHNLVSGLADAVVNLRADVCSLKSNNAFLRTAFENADACNSQLTGERDAALAREPAAFARGVQAAKAAALAGIAKYMTEEYDTPAEVYIEDAIRALADAPPAPQCCMCGKKGLSTVEDDGGTECGLDDGRWVCSADCYDRAYPDAPPVVGVGVKPLVREELENIEKQLHVNEGYFDGSQRTTLEILQGHIKDSVSRIRAALEGDA